MPLLAFNKTGSPVTIAGTSIVVPASTSPPLRGPAFNVTAEFRSLSAGQFAAIEAQSSSLDFEWTSSEEFATAGLTTSTVDGTPGAIWRHGNGVPANSLGINGDFYLNDATSDVYVKSAGVYSLTVNIKGATGAQGPQGQAGATGDTGPEGPEWDGISTWVADGVIVANTLVKASSSTDSRVVQLTTADDPALAIGVALDAAAGAGVSIRVVSEFVPVQIKSDGSGTITRGAMIEVSTTVNGRVRQRTTGQSIGTALTNCAATLDALVTVY
jgi:hypothetical protein